MEDFKQYIKQSYKLELESLALGDKLDVIEGQGSLVEEIVLLLGDQEIKEELETMITQALKNKKGRRILKDKKVIEKIGLIIKAISNWRSLETNKDLISLYQEATELHDKVNNLREGQTIRTRNYFV